MPAKTFFGEIMSAREDAVPRAPFGEASRVVPSNAVAHEIPERVADARRGTVRRLEEQRGQIRDELSKLRESGIENILALRGDIPDGMDPSGLEYHYASELTADIKAFGGFCISGACYPESHPESKSSDEDIENLRRKVDAGCEFLTTQMFFDNNIYYNFLYRLRERGIGVPVIAGIMPVTNASSIKRICRISGTALPQRFVRIVDRFGQNPEAMKQAGIAYATEQIIDLFANGVRAVHVYSMNKPDVARAIRDNLSEILK